MSDLKKIILFIVLLIALTGCIKPEITPLEESSSEIKPAPGADIPEPLPAEIKEGPSADIELPEEILTQSKPTTEETPKEEPKTPAETTEAKETVFIEIKEFEFVPSKLTIKKGTTVVWKNIDDDAHIFKQVGKSFLSPIIKSGETFEHTFTEEEVVKYTDLNYGTRGEIVVE